MIALKNIHFGYSRRKPLFMDLSLELKGGHIYGLLGKNGAGKTTLLKNMAGLRFVQAGSCQMFGIDAKRRDPELLRTCISCPKRSGCPTCG